MKLHEELEKIVRLTATEGLGADWMVSKIEELFIKIVKESKPKKMDVLDWGIGGGLANSKIDEYEKNLLEAIKSE